MVLTNPFSYFRSGDEPSDSNTSKEHTRYTGQIMYVNKHTNGGGYGFIKCADIPFERIFFHWTELIGYKFMELEKDTNVSFFAFESKEFTDDKGAKRPGRGWIASKVRVEVIDTSKDKD